MIVGHDSFQFIHDRSHGHHRRLDLLRTSFGSLLRIRHAVTTVIRTALVMMRQPARMADMGALQDFLERGFAAFRSMGGAATFLGAVQKRETDILEAMVGGVVDAFPDPLDFRAPELLMMR